MRWCSWEHLSSDHPCRAEVESPFASQNSELAAPAEYISLTERHLRFEENAATVMHEAVRDHAPLIRQVEPWHTSTDIVHLRTLSNFQSLAGSKVALGGREGALGWDSRKLNSGTTSFVGASTAIVRGKTSVWVQWSAYAFGCDGFTAIEFSKLGNCDAWTTWAALWIFGKTPYGSKVFLAYLVSCTADGRAPFVNSEVPARCERFLEWLL